VSEGALAQRDLARTIRRLRRDINVAADAIRETYDELRPEAGEA
jgi:hypothetical protein